MTNNPQTTGFWNDPSTFGNQLKAAAEENARLKARAARLTAVAERLIEVTNTFIQDSSDPGTEALAAVWSARQELQRHD